jgi:hypothetical protein
MLKSVYPIGKVLSGLVDVNNRGLLSMVMELTGAIKDQHMVVALASIKALGI